MIKKMALLLLVMIVVITANSCSNNNGDEPPPQEPIAWGQLSGIWQIYYDGESVKYHDSWVYIKDQGEVLAFYDCRTPTWKEYEKTRENNIYTVNDIGGYAKIVSGEEIQIIHNMTAFPEITYAMEEPKDSFSMGSFSMNVMANDSGLQWSVGATNTFCAEISDQREINSGWLLESYADNVKVEMFLKSDDFSGNFTPNDNLHMRVASALTSSWGEIFVSEGNVNCEYTAQQDLYCSFNVSGLGKTAIGEFVLQKEYLVAKNSVIDSAP